MEFPDLGQHCSETSCKQLDFLPMKCNACSKIFCNIHFSYVQHNCPEAYKKDNQVPVCPLCNVPIPVPRGQMPDVVVGQHIDNDCQSDPAKEKRKRIYTNRCSAKGCKTKELIPFNCEKCRQNFCIRHRLESDHECKGFQGSGRGVSQAGAAASSRAGSNPPAARPPAARPQQSAMSAVGRDLDRERRERMQQRHQPQPQPQPGRSVNLRAMQANMSEDEALAQAVALSLSDSSPPTSNSPPKEMTAQEAEDHALAQAIAESERVAAEQRRRGNQSSANRDKSCLLS